MISVALPLLGSAILLISCSRHRAEQAHEQENIMTLRSDTLTIVETKNGAVNSRFYAPLVEEYKYAPSPYREFPRGIDIITYDSLGNVKSTLVANYALFWMDLELWETKGDVKATNQDGDMLETPQLFWNQKTERVYSNNHTRLTQGEDVLEGEGFESDQDFTEWVFRKPRGVLGVDAEPNRSDSTRVEPALQDSVATQEPTQPVPPQDNENGEG